MPRAPALWWRRRTAALRSWGHTRRRGALAMLFGSWDIIVAYLVGALAGTLAGLAVAAGGLALAGQSLFGIAGEQAQLFLVLGPLLGLLPLSLVALAAARRPAVAAHLPRILGLWLVLGTGAAYWFGIR
ncbi:MAG: hypothetical protein ACRDJN_18155, partial [Chloroflexota bacterium]